MRVNACTGKRTLMRLEARKHALKVSEVPNFRLVLLNNKTLKRKFGKLEKLGKLRISETTDLKHLRHTYFIRISFIRKRDT